MRPFLFAAEFTGPGPSNFHSEYWFDLAAIADKLLITTGRRAREQRILRNVGKPIVKTFFLVVGSLLFCLFAQPQDGAAPSTPNSGAESASTPRIFYPDPDIGVNTLAARKQQQLAT